MDGKLRNMTSLYLVKADEVLCLYRMGSRVADQRYVGSAGGHFEENEISDARACVLREAREELGLLEQDLQDLKLRYITYRLKNGEIRQNYYFFASLKESRPLVRTEGELRWVPFSQTHTLHMPVSAYHMLQHYVKIGRFDSILYAGITEETGTSFVPMTEFED